MASIELRGQDEAEVKALSEQLMRELQALSSDVQWQVQYNQIKLESRTDEQISRGDPITWTMVVAAAVSAGGAATVFFSKDGFLASIAQVIEKYIEGKKTELVIKSSDGSSFELRSTMSAGDIQKVLREMNRRDNAASVPNTSNNAE